MKLLPAYEKIMKSKTLRIWMRDKSDYDVCASGCVCVSLSIHM